MKKLEDPEIYTRLNSRVKKSHIKAIKADANKKPKRTEGEVLRSILDKHYNIK